MKPTYTRRNRAGLPIGDPVPYDPLIVISGSMVHKLALHKDDSGQWVIAHPASGGKVTRVDSTYKGVPVSSRGMTLARARNLAMIKVEALIEHVGPDAFNNTLQKASV
jgi:hypothetical protein